MRQDNWCVVPRRHTISAMWQSTRVHRMDGSASTESQWNRWRTESLRLSHNDQWSACQLTLSDTNFNFQRGLEIYYNYSTNTNMAFFSYCQQKSHCVQFRLKNYQKYSTKSKSSGWNANSKPWKSSESAECLSVPINPKLRRRTRNCSEVLSAFLIILARSKWVYFRVANQKWLWTCGDVQHNWMEQWWEFERFRILLNREREL